MNKLAEDNNKNVQAEEAAKAIQSAIDIKKKELADIKSSIWSNPEDRNLLAAAIGAGVGGLGGFFLAPTDKENSWKRNFKTKLKYALLGAGLGGLGGAALMYGGIGSVIEGQASQKEKEIKELQRAKNVNAGKIDTLDLLGTAVGYTGLIPDSWIEYRNNMSPVGLTAADTAALLTAGATARGLNYAGVKRNISIDEGGFAARVKLPNGKYGFEPQVGRWTAFKQGFGGGFTGKRWLTAGGLSLINSLIKNWTASPKE